MTRSPRALDDLGDRAVRAKRILGYADRLAARPGERVEFKISAPDEAVYRAQLVRLVAGDARSADPEVVEIPVAAALNGEHPGRRQAVAAGSAVVAGPCPPWPTESAFTLALSFRPTRAQSGRQHLLGRRHPETGTGWSVRIEAGRLAFGSGRAVAALDRPLENGVWYRAAVRVDLDAGTVTLDALPLSRGPGHPPGRADRATAPIPVDWAEALPLHAAAQDVLGPFVIGAAAAGRSRSGRIRPEEGFFGRIEAPVIVSGLLTDDELETVWAGRRPGRLRGRLVADWDFSLDIGSSVVTDRSPNDVHGHLVNLPLRGVRGSGWTGREFSRRHAPDQYSAIEFHGDDLSDCDWETDLAYEVPADLPSGIYAVRIRLVGPSSEGEEAADERAEDHIPFVVAPPRGRPGSDVAILVPTNTYLAYGNVRAWSEGFAESGLAPEQFFANTWTGPGAAEYSLTLLEHPELGSSTYDRHADGTPVHFSTWRRPLLNMRPKSVLWTLSADLLLVAWLEAQGIRYDILTDDLLDGEGADLLAGYRLVITGNHPEYVTTAELDALEEYLAGGGRLMYLGGNGFYWRCALDREAAAIEIRRGRVGTATWRSPVGESDLALSDEPGGMWRELGRPPQRLVGVGFIAEGRDGAVYRLLPGIRDGRAGFLVRGVDDDVIGTSGAFGTAVAQEIDRGSVEHGTPPHALVVARSTGHGPGMVFAIEEMRAVEPDITKYRDETYSEVVFFEHPGGGAVFAAGSMAWVGSLRTDAGVSTITRNALDRMRDPEPFTMP